MNAKEVKQKYGVAVGSRLNHPLYGIGEIRKIAESLEIRWENPYHRIKGPVSLDEADLQYMTKVISEEKKMSSKTKKKVLEFDLPDASDTILTGTDKMPNGASAPLGTMDGNAGANKNWSPSVMKDVDGELGDVKVADIGGKGASATAKKSAPKSDSSDSEPRESAPKSDDESDYDFQKRKVSEMDLSWSELAGLSESEDEDEDEEDDVELEECGDADMNKKIKEHDMASGEIAITKELFKAVVQAAINDQPDEAAVAKMADAFASCCGDRTLDVADIGEIMAVARGESSGSEAEVEDVAPSDGEIAGDEAGEDHEGKKMLMAGQVSESKKADKKKADEKKKKDDKKKGKLDEAWLARIPNASVIGKSSDLTTKIDESDDEDTVFLKQIAARAGVKYRG